MPHHCVADFDQKELSGAVAIDHVIHMFLLDKIVGGIAARVEEEEIVVPKLDIELPIKVLVEDSNEEKLLAVGNWRWQDKYSVCFDPCRIQERMPATGSAVVDRCLPQISPEFESPMVALVPQTQWEVLVSALQEVALKVHPFDDECVQKHCFGDCLLGLQDPVLMLDVYW